MSHSLFGLGDFYSILTAVTWAIAVIYYRLAGFHLDSFPLKVFQNTVTVGLFLLSSVLLGQSLHLQLSWSEWSLLIGSGFFGVTVGDTLYVAAINRVGAGTQAILDCFYSPFVIAIAYFIYDEKLTLAEGLGALLVLAAVLIAGIQMRAGFSGKANHSSPGQWTGLAFGIGSQLTFALTVLLLKGLLQKDSVFVIMTYRYLIGNLLLIGAAPLVGRQVHLFAGFRWNKHLKWSVPGALLGPYLASLFWFLGFKYTLAGRAAVYNQLSSIFIIIFATLFLREKLTKHKLAAILLAILGGILVGL